MCSARISLSKEALKMGVRKRIKWESLEHTDGSLRIIVQTRKL